MKTLKKKINDKRMWPYVYSYPPTRSYEKEGLEKLKTVEFANDINVYVHIPFCEQRCTFCGYLTVVDRSEEARERYVAAVIREIEGRTNLLAMSNITSVNFGGGTPSLLVPKQIRRIMEALERANPKLFETASEISIEATPESIQSGKIADMQKCGINRVSVGVQSFDSEEIISVRRHNTSSESIRAIQLLKTIGIANVCVDLMYGLPGQTFESWKRSLDILIGLQPETIELYDTVMIPETPLARKETGVIAVSVEFRRQCKSYAYELLRKAGYTQDCHVRFILNKHGGYCQQENVFAGQSLLGFGVGARSYAENAHFRNVYQNHKARTAVAQYENLVNVGQSPVESIVYLDIDEQMRRWAIYNIEQLNLDRFEKKFGVSFAKVFPRQWAELQEENLVEVVGGYLVLTQRAMFDRDLIATEFFSNKVMGAENAYYNR